MAMRKGVAVVVLPGLVLALAGAAPVPAPRPAEKDSPAVMALLKERRDVLREAVDFRTREFLAGRGTLDILLSLSQKMVEAELALPLEAAGRVAVYKKYHDHLKSIEEVNQGRFDAGRISIGDLLQTRAARIEAEIWLLRAGGKVTPPEKEETRPGAKVKEK